VWIIDEAIELPSDIEILIDGAHLRLADGVFCNMFTVNSPERNTAADSAKNIILRGKNNALLDGGNYNGLSEKNCHEDGRPHISKNTMLLIFNAENILVENLRIINQRWWAITNIFVSNSVYRNISFNADISRIDENGVHYPDELPRNYKETYVKNADGIDLRIGCHDMLIENISGTTEDDSVALTALGGFERRLGYVVDGASHDIHDVTVKNISTNAYTCANVRLLNDNGNKLYNVLIDGVTSLHPRSEYRSNSAVRIGDKAYADTDSKLGDTHHITVRNIVSSSKYAVSICKGLSDSVIENVTVLDGQTGISAFSKTSATLKNCRIENILTLSDDSVAINTEGITFID
jgi:polygalacturonase